jgi:hypothetical protein
MFQQLMKLKAHAILHSVTKSAHVHFAGSSRSNNLFDPFLKGQRKLPFLFCARSLSRHHCSAIKE